MPIENISAVVPVALAEGHSLWPVVGGLMGIVAAVVWILALVDSARNGRWLWFVLTLLFWPLALFYVVIQYPQNRRERRADQLRRSRRRKLRAPESGSSSES